MLQGKKIIVGVSGSIAAYKAAYLVRLLVQAGAEVRVMLTNGALEFVTPLTFSTLSKNPVHSDFTENKESGVWVNHVDMALWADMMILAPLTANTLSKMAHGQCDSFYMAVYMSARCPVFFAPAMDHDMFLHGATVENIEKLVSFGHHLLEPGEGELASGLIGKGRMVEPEEIVQGVVSALTANSPLHGKHFLVTAGPTYEAIDPVRFIGNHSTGKMGFALAEALANMGARITLVAGPCQLQIHHPLVHRVDVTTATEMLDACLPIFERTDGAVLAAAVADYMPEETLEQKLKKSDEKWSLSLVKTPDIAMALGALKRDGQCLVGFALETNNEASNATQKLERKKLDLIVLNSLRDAGAGFGTDTNPITLIWRDNKSLEFGLKPKSQVAVDIAHAIVEWMNT
ncbi:MAG: bifunctional phosphopantothenoylcysteine decarboxylase/phosphopantothenate--cysteine ligase CoaBC [Flavobacteriales bacterium]